jgi:hypothetical protein
MTMIGNSTVATPPVARQVWIETQPQFSNAPGQVVMGLARVHPQTQISSVPGQEKMAKF